jgi:hypothetical protein
MLSNNQDTIDGKGIPTASQCLSDGRVHLETELLRTGTALISFRRLVCIQGDHFHIGPMPVSATRIAYQKTVREMLGMGQIAIDGTDYSESFGWLVGHGTPGFGDLVIEKIKTS